MVNFESHRRSGTVLDLLARNTRGLGSFETVALRDNRDFIKPISGGPRTHLSRQGIAESRRDGKIRRPSETRLFRSCHARERRNEGAAFDLIDGDLVYFAARGSRIARGHILHGCYLYPDRRDVAADD